MVSDVKNILLNRGIGNPPSLLFKENVFSCLQTISCLLGLSQIRDHHHLQEVPG